MSEFPLSIFTNSHEALEFRRKFPRPNVEQLLNAHADHMLDGNIILGVNPLDNAPAEIKINENLRNPLLALGDSGAGKTGLLMTAALSLELAHTLWGTDEAASYAVVTTRQQEWQSYRLSHNEGVFLPESRELADYLSDLTDERKSDVRPLTVLFLDGIEGLLTLSYKNLYQILPTEYTHSEMIPKEPLSYDRTRKMLVEVLTKGQKYGVLSVATYNTDSPEHGDEQWLPYFHDRIFGRINQYETAQSLLHHKYTREDHAKSLGSLMGGGTFAYFRAGEASPFWTPVIS